MNYFGNRLFKILVKSFSTMACLTLCSRSPMLPRKVVPVGYPSLSSQSFCGYIVSSEAYFFITVLTLSILLYLKISTGAAAGNSLNSTLIDNLKVLSCYLAGCTALSTVGFVEFVSHMFATLHVRFNIACVDTFGHV
jgi:hypothetical protein